MKKQGWIILCLCGLLCLTGCGAPTPEAAADGSAPEILADFLERCHYAA